MFSIDIIFVIHMALTFITAIEVNGKLIADPKKIAIEYIKGPFIFDCIINLPIPQLLSQFMVI